MWRNEREKTNAGNCENGCEWNWKRIFCNKDGNEELQD